MPVQCVAGRQRPCSDASTSAPAGGSYYGGILADEMGLGKTLQVLATSWTLMQRGGPFGKPMVRKMLVVAPSSVIKNWGNEIQKWLGMERAAYLVLLPGKEAANQVRCIRWKTLQLTRALESYVTQTRPSAALLCNGNVLHACCVAH